MQFFSTLRKLCPIEEGPWWSLRHYVYSEMIKLNVQPGDIVCRMGNSYVYGYLHFSRFICHLTGSNYSHAALVLEVNDQDILLGDVDTAGLRRQYIGDWCNDIRGEDILILRYKGSDLTRKLAVQNAKQVLKINPLEDGEFLDSNDGVIFYCVELVCWCYLRAGVSLCDEVPINKLPNWKKWLNGIAKLYGIDYTLPVWCVGNKDIGLISSPHLKELGKIPYFHKPSKNTSKSCFTGA